MSTHIDISLDEPLSVWVGAENTMKRALYAVRFNVDENQALHMHLRPDQAEAASCGAILCNGFHSEVIIGKTTKVDDLVISAA